MRASRVGRAARIGVLGLVALFTCATVSAAGIAGAATSPDGSLDGAVERFVAAPGGSPGIAVVVQSGDQPVLHTAGVADTTTKAQVTLDDSMRLASVSKAFSGAAALAEVAKGSLSLDDTVGRWLPHLPKAWTRITLSQLLQHTSGVPDYTEPTSFWNAFSASPNDPPQPEKLLSFAESVPLEFQPGTRFHYSNSDNVIVGLMIEAATDRSYRDVLAADAFRPLGLNETSLPAGADLPSPAVHGYVVDPPKEPKEIKLAMGWVWAQGGIVSTPRDANTFVRGYVAGRMTTVDLQRAQFTFRAGSSQPPGPGRNSAGLALFRYRTKCGEVFGHTGNTFGYTQFVAASRDGTRSVVVSINAQIRPDTTPERFADLRRIDELAVCAALS